MASTRSKQLISNSGILFVRMIVTMVISFFTTRLVLQALGVTDYGVYNVVCGITSMMTVISNSLTEGVSRFITVEVGSNDEKRINKVFAVSNTALLIVTIAFVILCETIGLYLLYKLNIPKETTNQAFWIYQLSVLTMVVSFNGIPYNGLLVAYEKFNAFGAISVLESLLRLAATAILFVFSTKSRLVIYAIGLLIAGIIIRVLYILYVFKIAPFLKYRFSTNKSDIKILGEFTGYKLLWEIANASGTQGVNIILNIFFGPVLNAARGIAIQVQGILYKLLLNFQSPLRPQIIKSYIDDPAYFKKLVFMGTKFSFYIISLILIFVLINIKMLLRLWLGNYPIQTEIIVILMCVEVLIYAAFMPLDAALDATGDIKKYKIWQSFLYMLILPLSYIGYKFGMSYIISFAITIVVQLFILCLRVEFICPQINISKCQMFLNIVKLSVMAVFGYCLTRFVLSIVVNEILILLTSIIIITVVETLFFFYVCLNVQEQYFFKSVIHRFKK